MSVKTKVVDGIGFITINRPEKGNCLSLEAIHSISQTARDYSSRSDVASICFMGLGPNFCSGADLDWMSESRRDDFLSLAEMYFSVQAFPGLIYCGIQGLSYGGGFGITCLADYVISKKNTRLCLPESNMGLIPGVLTPFAIRKIGVKTFLNLSKTADVIGPEVAQKLKLVDTIVDNQVDLSKYVQENFTMDRALSILLKQDLAVETFEMDQLEELTLKNWKLSKSETFKRNYRLWKKRKG
ncbi:MAG: enoyl-CoA hydratase/isomerase family protein [Bdellovibrionales bacterium]|nr:enoyl-CoA hydratase/isomerase family protein [Bdellovibrionales bacterium]